MIRKYHNHKLSTNPWHLEEEPHASSQSLRFILSLKLYSSFITSRPDSLPERFFEKYNYVKPADKNKIIKLIDEMTLACAESKSLILLVAMKDK